MIDIWIIIIIMNNSNNMALKGSESANEWALKKKE